jgi:hypothetical protein
MAPFTATYATTVTHDVQRTRKEAEVSQFKFRNIPGGSEETQNVRQTIFPDFCSIFEPGTKQTRNMKVSDSNMRFIS